MAFSHSHPDVKEVRRQIIGFQSPRDAASCLVDAHRFGQEASFGTRPLSVDFHTHILPSDIPDFEQRFGYEGFVTLADCGCTDGSKNMMLGTGKGEKKFFRKASLLVAADCARLDLHAPARTMQVEKNCFDPGLRLEECERDKVDVQVLSTVPVMFSYPHHATSRSCGSAQTSQAHGQAGVRLRATCQAGWEGMAWRVPRLHGRYWASPTDALEVCRFINDNLAETCRQHPHNFVALGTVPLQAPELAIQELRRCMGELGMKGVQIGTHVEFSSGKIAQGKRDETATYRGWNLDAPELFPFFQVSIP
jgi:aminocarboxymuconate-semialdehyde decarboxylase